MNEFYEFIKNVYTKKDFFWLDSFYDKVNAIAIMTVLGKDDDSLKHLKRISKYIYALRNDHLLILMHNVIPRRLKAPWIKYYKKSKEEKIDKLHIRIKKYFLYSDKEYSYIKDTVDFFIKRDLQQYYTAFGINK